MLPPPPAPAATTPVAPPTERPPLEGLPSITLSGAPDPWRDRIRVVLDRVIYLVALVSVVLLARAKALDLQTAAAILLVAGVRPHNLFEALRGGGARGAMVLPLLLDNLRSGSWLAR